MINIEEVKNTIINADCLDILKQLPDKCVDLVLTDPPYVIDNLGGTKSPLAKRCAKVRDIIDDFTKDFNFYDISKELLRVCKYTNIVMFCSKQQVSRTMFFFEDNGFQVNLCVWDKTNPAPLGNNKLVNNLEYIVVVRGTGAYFNNDLPISKKRMSFVYPTGRKEYHPCEKPIELISDLMSLFSKENHIVLDCFSGSGTTAVVSHKLKRNFICVEKDPEYWKVSCKRLEDEQRQGTLF
jgi:DNA modification methylase